MNPEPIDISHYEQWPGVLCVVRTKDIRKLVRENKLLRNLRVVDKNGNPLGFVRLTSTNAVLVLDTDKLQ